MIRNASVLLCSALLLLLAAPAQADDSEAGGISRNVLVTITVAGGNESAERSYQLVARDRTGKARLLTGWRVPIPTTTSGSPALTSYTYQNVGLTAEIQARVLPDSQVALRGEIEISRVTEPTAKLASGLPPTIGTFQQGFNVVLHEGDPLDLAVVSTPDGGRLTVRLKAEAMR